MKAKVSRGGGFRGALNYVFDAGRKATGKKKAERVGGNLAGNDPTELSREFAAVRRLRPDVKRPVWHCSLSLPPDERLDSQKWEAVAADFMERMGFDKDNTPWVAVRHQDTDKDHIHIVASRVGLDGKVWLGQWEARRVIEATQELEHIHGLTLTPGLGDARAERRKLTDKEINMAVRTGEEPPRQRLQRLLDEALKDKPTVVELAERLQAAGVNVRANMASTGRMSGFSFEVGGVPFKGSDLGKGYTWAGLQKAGVTYDEARDRAGLERFRAAVADRGERSDVAAIGEPDAGRPASPAQRRLDRDGASSPAIGQDGQGIGSGLRYPEGDHGASDTGRRGISPERDADAFAGQGEAVREYGTRAAPEKHADEQKSAGLDAGSQRLKNTENQPTGADQPMETPVLGGDRVGGDAGRGAGPDDFGEAPVAWNTRFKQASAAKRRGREQPVVEIGRRAEFERLRDSAHAADLVAYMQSIGLPVERDGVKGWLIDDRYRVTKKQDGNFVWCSWDQSRGGDPISFCTDEQRLSFQQAIADLSGGRLVQTNRKEWSGGDRFPASPPICRNSDPVMQYLEDRGISQKTIRRAQGAGFLRFVDYAGTPCMAFCGLGDNGKLRSMTVCLTNPILSWDGRNEITKIDIKHSDKSFPALWRGVDPNLPSDKSLWVVEGGIDALAIVDWYRASQKAVPDIVVSGGVGVRSFLDRPHVRDILSRAVTVYVALEREKDRETQILTDASYQRQIEKIQAMALGCDVVAWRPPVGSKDVADAWNAGVLPDPHDLLANKSGEDGGSGGEIMDDAVISHDSPSPESVEPS